MGTMELFDTCILYTIPCRDKYFYLLEYLISFYSENMQNPI